MSFKRFNHDANQAMELGQDAVRQLNFNFFGTEGILLGLLAVGNNIAAQVLRDSGVSFETTLQRVQQCLASEAVPAEQMPDQLAFAPRAFRVLELSHEALNQIPSDASREPIRANPGHLLLGILQEAKEGGGVASQILSDDFGLDLSQLEQQLCLAMTAVH